MKIIKFESLELHLDEQQTLSTNEVALGYGVSAQTIRDHKNRFHSDEIIKNTHYIEAWDDKFKRYVTRWTLEGVHMLGFFIKSERAKEFRKFTAKLLSEIKKGNAQVMPTLHCPASDNLNTRITGYKGMLARKQKELDELRFKLAVTQDELKTMKKETNPSRLLTSHHLLDLSGELARHNLSLARKAEELEYMAKDLKRQAKNAQMFLDQIVKNHPKAKKVADTARLIFKDEGGSDANRD